MPKGSRPVGRGVRRGRGLRRAASQTGLIVSLWAVLVACSTAAGISVLLVTAGNDTALSAAVSAADGDVESGSVDIATVVVTADTLEGSTPPGAKEVMPLTSETILNAAAPYQATVSMWASTPMLYLPGDNVQRGYLLDADTVQSQASLVAGEWPSADVATSGPIEVAIPLEVATRLGLGVGADVRLSESRQHGAEVPQGYDVVVVGVFDPSRSATWHRDPLRGAGFDPDYAWLPAYGPFVVAPGTLVALDAPVARVSAVVDPDLAGDATHVQAFVGRMYGIASDLEGELGPQINSVVVRSELGDAFAGMQSELSLTDSLVISVFLQVLALGMATVALVARVLARRRAVEVEHALPRGLDCPAGAFFGGGDVHSCDRGGGRRGAVVAPRLCVRRVLAEVVGIVGERCCPLTRHRRVVVARPRCRRTVAVDRDDRDRLARAREPPTGGTIGTHCKRGR